MTDQPFAARPTASPARWLVMGVSGSGKSTLGRAWATRLGQRFFDADDFHPPASVAKMSRGVALTDADRWPWLERLNRLLREQPAAVLACSALKRSYRRRLAEGVDDLRTVYLHVDPATLATRMQGREHFMPPALLASQLATLEAPGPGEAITLEGDRPLELLLEQLERAAAGR